MTMLRPLITVVQDMILRRVREMWQFPNSLPLHYLLYRFCACSCSCSCTSIAVGGILKVCRSTSIACNKELNEWNG